MIPKSHPYWHMRAILERRSDVSALHMSYYEYRPQTVKDDRQNVQVSLEEFLDEHCIQALMKGTPTGHELAFHSDVTLTDGQKKHLVMVDMSTGAKAHLDKLRAYLGDHFYQTITWYTSGRSFHGYGEDLLAESDWVRFMGLLLLANKPRVEPTVDPRWIGHRLLAGYAGLRWTKNSSHYLMTPTKLEQYSPVRTFEVGPLGKQLRRS
jgi:hypothetical protein